MKGLSAVKMGAIRSIFMKQQGGMRVTQANQADLILLKEFIGSGKLKPLIDRTVTLEQIPEALGYAEQGHVRGKVMITIK